MKLFLLHDSAHCQERHQPEVVQHKTSSPLQVRALYSFHAEERDELEFNAGDIIEVLESSDKDWWKGKLRGKTGLFPCNYIKPI
ncbi:SH3 domain-containing YSC84-like protein 1 [Collichthys lucidus]|uniref:Osteoclast-stimulating factor 1 n=1 Tax=Collichthys lucidus TaxID=240159 RepID=A0A4U5U369_COLLU|nr:SH3 domain-containing YSC84-like protein 1 [Collichthys lucidus]TKS68633.1 SH3 domain-containing YSC84-like protein 1 [Collichthys lucidus]